MKYFLDASAIYKLAEVNKLDLMENSITLDLARYELGNAVLKDCIIHKHLDVTKAQQLIGFLYELLDTIDKVSAADSDGIMKAAVDFRLSFYDSAYVQSSEMANLTLVTEDEKLLKKVKSHIKVISVEEMERTK